MTMLDELAKAAMLSEWRGKRTDEMEGGEKEYWRNDVRAILERLKTPAPAMLKAGHDTVGDSISLYEMRTAFLAMIQFVLDDPLAQRIEARSDETPQAVQPEGREPDPKDAPKGGSS